MPVSADLLFLSRGSVPTDESKLTGSAGRRPKAGWWRLDTELIYWLLSSH